MNIKTENNQSVDSVISFQAKTTPVHNTVECDFLITSADVVLFSSACLVASIALFER